MTADKFSIDEVEAALCVWEELLTRYAANEPAVTAYRDARGAAEMRMESIPLGKFVHETYLLIDEDLRDERPFDWEFVPAILNTVTFGDTITYPTPEEAAKAVEDSMRVRAPGPA